MCNYKTFKNLSWARRIITFQPPKNVPFVKYKLSYSLTNCIAYDFFSAISVQKHLRLTLWYDFAKAEFQNAKSGNWFYPMRNVTYCSIHWKNQHSCISIDEQTGHYGLWLILKRQRSGLIQLPIINYERKIINVKSILGITPGFNTYGCKGYLL